ncbi:MAG: sterol desaturase family protein [Myxococcota bacterium]
MNRATHPRTPGLSLADAARIFSRAASARILVAFAVHALAYRLWVGGFSRWDVLLVVGQIALQPFTEWVVHVFVLHLRPRRLGRFTLDTRLAKDHRAHHQDPHEPRWWFIPVPSLVPSFIGPAIVAHLVLPAGLAATFALTAILIGLAYEWTHYLCHSTYKPRSKAMKRLVRNHRLHHFKNERFWMGVTLLAGDRLLGTMKSPRDVDTSPTCRDVLAAYKAADKSPR